MGAAPLSSGEPAAEEWAFTAHGLKRVNAEQKAEDLFQLASRKRKRGAEVSLASTVAPSDAAALAVNFQAWKKEVQDFGASNLGKKDRQSFEERKMAALGIKAPAPPRMSAKMGLGVAKKAKERAAKAEQDLIDAGMLQVKGKGKKKAALRQKNRDKGLDEADGFTPGLLKIRAPPKNAEHGRGLARLDIQREGGSRGRGGRGRGARGGGRGGRGGGAGGRGGGGGSRGGRGGRSDRGGSRSRGMRGSSH